MSAEGAQLMLPAVEAELVEQLVAPESSPLFSGCTGEHRSRIKLLRERILELGLCGVGAKATARALEVSPQVVRAVRASAWKSGELAPLKERLGRDYLAVADLLRAEALERSDEIPAHVLLLASAQAADKGQLFTGGVTQRVETRAVPADLNELISALPIVPVEGERGEGQKGVDPLGSIPVEVKLLGSSDASQCKASDKQSDALPREAGGCGCACGSQEVGK